MKKLLTLLSTLAIVSTTATSIVGCKAKTTDITDSINIFNNEFKDKIVKDKDLLNHDFKDGKEDTEVIKNFYSAKLQEIFKSLENSLDYTLAISKQTIEKSKDTNFPFTIKVDYKIVSNANKNLIKNDVITFNFKSKIEAIYQEFKTQIIDNKDLLDHDFNNEKDDIEVIKNFYSAKLQEIFKSLEKSLDYTLTISQQTIEKSKDTNFPYTIKVDYKILSNVNEELRKEDSISFNFKSKVQDTKQEIDKFYQKFEEQFKNDIYIKDLIEKIKNTSNPDLETIEFDFNRFLNDLLTEITNKSEFNNFSGKCDIKLEKNDDELLVTITTTITEINKNITSSYEYKINIQLKK